MDKEDIPLADLMIKARAQWETETHNARREEFWKKNERHWKFIAWGGAAAIIVNAFADKF